MKNIMLAFSFGSWIVCGQSRAIIPEDLIKARPAPAVHAAAPRLNYQSSLRAPAASAGANIKQIGVTVWKLRNAAPGDAGARILVQEESSTTELTPVRLNSTSGLGGGDRVRLSIESAVSGYLYVIDRERYTSGSGDAYLIFPTTRTREGDNHVSAGRLIDIPGQEDQPNFFTVRKSRPNQLGEELLVIVSEVPLQGLTLGSKALLLEPERVQRWEREWNARSERFDLTDGAGKPWTREEQLAGASATRVLTQTDPAPQTVYRVASAPGKPVLVKVDLRIAR